MAALQIRWMSGPALASVTVSGRPALRAAATAVSRDTACVPTVAVLSFFFEPPDEVTTKARTMMATTAIGPPILAHAGRAANRPPPLAPWRGIWNSGPVIVGGTTGAITGGVGSTPGVWSAMTSVCSVHLSPSCQRATEGSLGSLNQPGVPSVMSSLSIAWLDDLRCWRPLHASSGPRASGSRDAKEGPEGPSFNAR